jgi:hypothetical protein
MPVKKLRELDVVRIVCLEKPSRDFGETDGVARPPEVGDVGTIVYADGNLMVMVECVEPSGMTLWLADFYLDEVELVASH